MAKLTKIEKIDKKESLKDKLIKNTTIQDASILTLSKIFADKDMTVTSVPMINVAVSGKLDGGMSPGILMISGESKNFKTGFSLFFASEYMKKYDDAMLLYYDSEFGSPEDYFKQFGIDPDRVMHTPVKDVEEFRHDIMQQLNNIERGDKLIVILDSVGNLASRKEVEDALEGKVVADMSRAKALKGVFRSITPHFMSKNITMIAINHIYQEIGMFPKDVVGGGKGSYYSASDIWIVKRRQEKEGDEYVGWTFIINIEKSRYVNEKSKIPITVSKSNFIEKYSGIFELALEIGLIKESTKGWYTIFDNEQKFRKKDLEYNADYMEKILTNVDFKNYIRDKYKLNTSETMEIVND